MVARSSIVEGPNPMATANKVTVIPCGAMTADLTWLLLKPGRSITDRNHKDAPAPWVDVPTHCVLVETDEGRMLWDTSCPRDWEERWGPTGLQDFFPYDKVSEDEYLDSRLNQLGVGLDQIDYVVLSHLHFDHAGNAQMFKDTNARLVCNDKERDFAFGFDGPVHRRPPQDRLRGPELRDGLRGHRVPPRRHADRDARAHRRHACRCRWTCPTPGTMIFTSDAVYMGESYGPPATPAAIVNNLESVLRLGGEAARHPGADERDDGVRPRRRADPPAARWRRRAPTHDGADVDLTEETIFTWGAPPLKFGAGATDEIGFELAGHGVAPGADRHRPGDQRARRQPQRIADNLRRYEIESEIFDGVHVEPTDDSMNKATEYARVQGPWDGFVAVGGGSAIDTAKAINLLTSHPGELMDYINKPIGQGQGAARASSSR